MSTLQIDHVSKLFRASTGGGQTPALRQVSFGIDPGEVVTLIGESGSGKTTLGKIILRLMPASSGTVTFEGVHPHRHPQPVHQPETIRPGDFPRTAQEVAAPGERERNPSGRRARPRGAPGHGV